MKQLNKKRRRINNLRELNEEKAKVYSHIIRIEDKMRRKHEKSPFSGLVGSLNWGVSLGLSLTRWLTFYRVANKLLRSVRKVFRFK